MHKCNRTDRDFVWTWRVHVQLTLKTVGTGLSGFGMNSAENKQLDLQTRGVEWHFEHTVPQSQYKYFSSDRVLWSVHLSLIG